jgi:hypothetical protein
VAGAVEFQLMKESLSQIFTPSRLFIYYYELAAALSLTTAVLPSAMASKLFLTPAIRLRPPGLMTKASLLLHLPPMPKARQQCIRLFNHSA